MRQRAEYNGYCTINCDIRLLSTCMYRVTVYTIIMYYATNVIDVKCNIIPCKCTAITPFPRSMISTGNSFLGMWYMAPPLFTHFSQEVMLRGMPTPI